MFLHDLKENQKATFLELAEKFVMVDDFFSGSENKLINFLKLEMGFTQDPERTRDNMEILLEVFDTKKARVSVLLEVIGLGYADGDYGIKEKEFINNLAKNFSISLSELTAMENWVLRQLTLAQEAAEFWAESDKEV